MFGWFTAFREHGAPTFYGEDRTRVTVDTHIIGLFSIFIIPSIAFLIIQFGIRKLRLASSLSFLFLMFVGATISVSLYHPCWHRADGHIKSQYKAFSSEKMDATLMVQVGLQHMNITLISPEFRHDPTKQNHSVLKYNERFAFTEVHRMSRELHNSLRKGLPYPILKVIEYLSVDGFGWGRHYRVAGYYASFMLWLSLFCWSIALLCLMFLPCMYSRLIFFTGICMGIGDVIFIWTIPRRMTIRFDNDEGTTILHFRPSICFHATCFTALACILVGGCLWWLDHRHFYHFDSMFTTKRYAEESVVDTYRDDSTISSVLSYDVAIPSVHIRKR